MAVLEPMRGRCISRAQAELGRGGGEGPRVGQQGRAWGTAIISRPADWPESHHFSAPKTGVCPAAIGFQGGRLTARSEIGCDSGKRAVRQLGEPGPPLAACRVCGRVLFLFPCLVFAWVLGALVV